nr:E3 ubiquitin/ISG15 ligase TRIM25-like [Danio rerio]|eukprot:XP_021330504.1 E3 ubiquitin/ISG15 ligase TRIM25-like [Danio rerio]
MAAAGVSWAEDQFMCPVCLDLLKSPVTIPCGHSYCMSCITDCWNQEEQKRIYSCPLCKQSFTPRPALAKNVVFAEMVEKLQKSRLQTAAPASVHTGSGDVECDACTGNKQKAVKSCQECRNSYCPDHLQHHESLFRGRGHNLMEATGRLQEMICPQHNKVMEIYCRTDQRCICMLCLVDGHKHHDTVTIAVARTEKQRQFEEAQRNIQKQILEKKKDLKQMRDAMESHKHSAQMTVEDSERVFAELIRDIEKRRSEVTKMIREQVKAARSRAEEHVARLELELDNLRFKDSELKKIVETKDHINFLKSCPSVSVSGSSDNVTVSSCPSFNEVMKSISQLRNKLQQFFNEEMDNISKKVKTVQVVVSREHATRKEFLQYSHPLTLDLNTVNYCIDLREGNTIMTVTNIRQPYPDHPHRFDAWTEALCREPVTGRCYWEVEWAGTGRKGVDIGVMYRSMKRKGDGNDSAAGRNEKSWSLFCSPEYCSFWHNNRETVLPVSSVSSKIGVLVDPSAGVLCFYSVSDTLSLIHRVQTTFTQPLYAVFGLDRQTVLKLPNQINDADIIQLAMLYHTLMMS